MKVLGTITISVGEDFEISDQTFNRSFSNNFEIWVPARWKNDTEDKDMFFLVVGKAVSIYDAVLHGWHTVELTPENLEVINKVQEAHSKRQ